MLFRVLVVGGGALKGQAYPRKPHLCCFGAWTACATFDFESNSSSLSTIMKFSKQLLLRAIPAWRDHYLDFKGLKKSVKSSAEKVKEAPDGERESMKVEAAKAFSDLLSEEARRVNEWYQSQETLGSKSLDRLSSPWNPNVSDEEKEKWMEELSALITDLENLLDFTKANLAGFKKIMKKFDKHMGTGITRDLWAVIADFRFAKSEMDELLLAEAKKLWRQRIPPVSLEPTQELSLLPDDQDIPTITTLSLDALPGGQISRMWIALGEDGAGVPMKVPVLVAKGVKTGPVVGITAALHGNELNGIPLVHRLFREINCKALHGTLVAVPVANIPGYLRSQRGYSEGTDLNRIFPGKSSGSAPQVYAHLLMERLVRCFTYLLDLHTASRGRVNSLYVRANMLDPRTRKMASLQNPQIIVHNKSPDGSLRGAAMDAGIAAITVEIGDPSRFQKRFIKNALLGVSNILAHLKMIPMEPDLPEFEPVICSRSFWIFADGGGVLTVVPEIYTWVRKGEPIAHLHSLFGGFVKTFYAPDDGIVIGKSVNPVCESGSRILHLGVVEDSFANDAEDGHL